MYFEFMREMGGTKNEEKKELFSGSCNVDNINKLQLSY